MVRNYKKKRTNNINENDVQRAVVHVINKTMTLRDAANVYGIKVSTLFNRVKKHREKKKLRSEEYSSNCSTRQVFTNAEEKMLESYLLKSLKMNYGLTYKQTRLLAYKYAVALNKCPAQWKKNEIAGIEWMKSFMKKHPVLSLRKPENTSLSRSISFNKHNVSEFQNNHEQVMKRYQFTADRIINLDETCVTTVVQAPKVIAQSGQKQVGQSVSAERGQLITMCAIVTAAGNTIPPVFIFPRARFHENMLIGAPIGSIGLANSPQSGWMTGSLFIKVLEHIQKATKCSKDDKILLLLDNHESHCSLDAIKFCRDNGIILLTFPPHCTHRLQPLDVAVMGPFKRKLSVSQNDWLLNNPGKTITIHHLASIVTPAYNAAFTPINITSGFSKPGIYPFSRNAFTEDDFQCSEVTNRPLTPSTSTALVCRTEPESSNSNMNTNMSTQLMTVAPDETLNQLKTINNENVADNTQAMSPALVQPFPKAAPRTEGKRGRKKGKSRILTDTPEKNEVEARCLERQSRLKKSPLLMKKTKITDEGAPKKIVKTRKKKAVKSKAD